MEGHRTELQPQRIGTILKGASYDVPLFQVTNDGLREFVNPSGTGGFLLNFCKGNKEDEGAHRQVGFFTESLIAVAKKYLEDVNVGELANREASMAITKLDEALMWIGKRAADRKARGVQATYQK